MAELAVACPGTTPADWWNTEPDDVLTVLDVLAERAG